MSLFYVSASLPMLVLIQCADLWFCSLRIDCRWVQSPSCYSTGNSETSKYINSKLAYSSLLSRFFFFFFFFSFFLSSCLIVDLSYLLSVCEISYMPDAILSTQSPVCLIYYFGGKSFLWFDHLGIFISFF